MAVKEEEPESEHDQIFAAEDVLPDASILFEEEPRSLTVVIDAADVVLDTNVLLIPFGATASSLQQIADIYLKLKEENRLFVPAQVAREYVKNRPVKLGQLDKNIGDQVSRLTVPEKFSYPILESSPEFDELNGLLEQLVELKKEIKSVTSEVRRSIREWGANDPVSQAYRPIFTKDIVVAPDYERSELVSEMRRRYRQTLPPGYKDRTKPDQGIGDFLIWKTILYLGARNKRDLVFVSGDEKADWMHGSDGSGFMARYELKAEFRSQSGGCDFYIIPLSKLLELRKAEAGSVDDIRNEEERIRDITLVAAECPECFFAGEYDLGEAVGSSAQPRCHSCRSKFYLHRTADGIVVRPFPKPTKEQKLEVVECPHCGDENLKELGLARNSTAWCICDHCETKFPIHRKYGGHVYVSTAAGG